MSSQSSHEKPGFSYPFLRQRHRFYVLIGLRAHAPTIGTKLATVFDAATSA
jgi:hypothetical protein